MKFPEIHSVYFLGIGGIGMSALARYFNALGKEVSGYDKTKSPLTEELEKEGIDIHYEDVTSKVDTLFFDKDKINSSLIVYTPAIPKDHEQLNALKDFGHKILKRSEVLGIISRETKTLAVAGTHGKTSTSAMLAHIFNHSSKGCTAFLGGILSNYNSNLILNTESDYCIVEADEFDRSFLTLSPHSAIITSTDADHLDIYGEGKGVLESFENFSALINKEGELIAHYDISALKNTCKRSNYGIGDSSEIAVYNLKVDKGYYSFDYKDENFEIKEIKLGLSGKHNVENACSAIRLSLSEGVLPHEIKEALASFTGVKRRFEYRYKKGELIFIDDYAHHPTELNALFDSVSEMFPNKRSCAIFQPHLFSRTRDFMTEFAESLGKFDELLLLDIYPARELPIEGVDSQRLLDKIKGGHKKLIKKSDLLDALKSSSAELYLSIGAGDIDREVEKISTWMEKEYGNNEINYSH